MKRKNKTWKPEYDEYLIKNYNEKTHEEMEIETGYHRRTLYNHAKRLGLSRNRQARPSKKEKHERKGQLWELLSGESSLC